MAASRLDRDSYARGFVRAAQYFANMLTSADVLGESRELIRGIFAPDLVCFCERGQCVGDCGLPGPDRGVLRRAVEQVFESGFMAMENLRGASRVCVVLPVTVRGRTENALIIGYAGEKALPSPVRVAVLGVAGLVGATLARQRADRELLMLAEERAARAAAEQSIALRDQFLAVASHELKTPLTGLMLVIGSAERSLQKLPHAPPVMRSKVAALSRQGRRLTDLVNNLLDVSRIQAGRLDVAIEQVDLCAVVRDVAERHSHEAAHAGCDLEVSARGPITGAWDHNGLDHIVSNLLSNAIKYGAGKPVSILAESDGETARLSVVDRGIGIAPHDQERIFQRFERAVPSANFGGIGLGLWIVRDIVTRLGGSIRVESRESEGARFTVDLPIRPP